MVVCLLVLSRLCGVNRLGKVSMCVLVMNVVNR